MEATILELKSRARTLLSVLLRDNFRRVVAGWTFFAAGGHFDILYTPIETLQVLRL